MLPITYSPRQNGFDENRTCRTDAAQPSSGPHLTEGTQIIKWISPQESRCITLLRKQAGKQIYSCEFKSANKPKRSQCTQYHWHLGYLALESRTSKGNISPLQIIDY